MPSESLNKKEIRASVGGKSFSELLRKLESSGIPFDIITDVSWITGDIRANYIVYSGNGLDAEFSRNNIAISRTGDMSELDRKLLELARQEYPYKVEKLPGFVNLAIVAPFLVSSAFWLYSVYSGRSTSEEIALSAVLGIFLLVSAGIPHTIGYYKSITPEYWKPIDTDTG